MWFHTFLCVAPHGLSGWHPGKIVLVIPLIPARGAARLFLAALTRRREIWLQMQSIAKLAHAIDPYLPHPDKRTVEGGGPGNAG